MNSLFPNAELLSTTSHCCISPVTQHPYFKQLLLYFYVFTFCSSWDVDHFFSLICPCLVKLLQAVLPQTLLQTERPEVWSPVQPNDFSSILCIQTCTEARPASSRGYHDSLPGGGGGTAGAWRWPLTSGAATGDVKGPRLVKARWTPSLWT
jgi:hypothetical protein